MNWIFYILIFLISCIALSWLSSRLVKSLIQIAQFLHWREFIIAFFVMALASSLPDLFVDLNAATHGMGELAFGDIIGGNFIDLTLVMAIAIFFSKKQISTKSPLVQKSAFITILVALLPLLLVLDSNLSRFDGAVLMGAFFAYSWWLLLQKGRPEKMEELDKKHPIKNFKTFLVNIAKIMALAVLLLAISQVIIMFAKEFSATMGTSLALVGILIVALGNCFPEAYFAVISARQERNWLVLGDLMGSVIISATLVLGIVAFVAPFHIYDFSPFLIARIFLIVGSICAFMFIRSGRQVTKKEGLLLLFIYIIFLLTEIFVKI